MHQKEGMNPYNGLTVHELQVVYEGSHTVALHPTSIAFKTGKWTCLIGANGAGKSSLLNAMAGVLHSSSTKYPKLDKGISLDGSPAVFWQGENLHQLPPKKRAQTLAWLGQTMQNNGNLADWSVWSVVMLGRLPHQNWWGMPNIADKKAASCALQAVHATNWHTRRFGELSGGEQQRVLLARCLAVQAPIVLMDEPLSHMDIPHQIDWLEMVKNLTKGGTTVVTVLHELEMALHADVIVIVDKGRVIHQGDAKDTETHRAIEQVFGQKIRILPNHQQTPVWTIAPHCAYELKNQAPYKTHT